MRTLLYIFSLTVATFISLTMNAADLPKNKMFSGYVVTIEGDTIQGRIEMISPTVNAVKVRLHKADGSVKTFKAKTLRGYAFRVFQHDKKEGKTIDEWIFYTRKKMSRAPMAFASMDVLVQQEIEGVVNLYNYYTESNEKQVMSHFYYLEQGGKELVELSEENYRVELRKFVSDSPEFAKRTGSRKLTYQRVPEFIADYNAWKVSNGMVSMK